MAYKKYIKRNGKIYGPYIYHSKRVDGKVVSEYRGQKDNAKLKKILVFSGLIVVIIALSYIMFSNLSITGNVVSNNQDPYLIKDDLSSNFQLTLKKGELIPEDAKIIVKTPQKYYGYDLKDLIENETSQGNYFLKDSKIEGKGSGFGVVGNSDKKTPVFFKIEIIKANSTNSSKIIQADINLEKPFKLKLKENETFQILEDSIQTEKKELSLDDLEIKQEDDEITISTSYSEGDQGFGKDYLNQEEIIYEIPLEKLLEEETQEFEIILSYNEEDISSFKSEIPKEEINETQEIQENKSFQKDKPNNESLIINNSETNIQEENNSKSNQTKTNNSQVNLTKNNTQIINSTNVSINNSTEIVQENKTSIILQKNITQEEINEFFKENLTMMQRNYRDKIIVTYSIDNYEMESTYDSSLSQEDFENKVKSDGQSFLIEIITQSKNSAPENEISSELIL